MKKSFNLVIPALLFVVFITNGCYNDNAEILYGPQKTDCSTVQAKFSTDIKPIINSKCAISGCHDGNAVNNGANLIFTSYALIIPHITRIQQRALIEKTMPPTGPLTSAETDKIKCWIASGALNN